MVFASFFEEPRRSRPRSTKRQTKRPHNPVGALFEAADEPKGGILRALFASPKSAKKGRNRRSNEEPTPFQELGALFGFLAPKEVRRR